MLVTNIIALIAPAPAPTTSASYSRAARAQ